MTSLRIVWIRPNLKNSRGYIEVVKKGNMSGKFPSDGECDRRGGRDQEGRFAQRLEGEMAM
jgi:hypothetical protein